MRIGQSTDIHRLVESRKLIIGGVEIPYHLGLLGHSDADVLVHAITEAIIGALGLGDLGTHFSDNEKKYQDIDSLVLLAEVVKMIANEDYKLGNIDALVIIEEPEIAPYIQKMKENIAQVLACPASLVNIKATTAEGLGFVGKKKGVVATATVLLKGREDE